jgi:hypothetical protein
MVTDEQVRRLKKLIKNEKTLGLAAAKSGMDEKTARKWRDSEKLPGECRVMHDWRTRADSFDGVWPEVRNLLEVNPGLQAKTIFDYLQRRSPGNLADGQLRTLQRRIKFWRATEGPPREVFFAQIHYPGKLAQSDFTHMSKLGVTIMGQAFDHLLYHFILTYSNWETGSICFSESFEALSGGLQSALWELGGVPDAHQTDQLTAAVNNLHSKDEFNRRYTALLDHYGLVGKKIQVNEPNENGDIEQSHNRLKTAVNQALMLRGSRDFSSAEEYKAFLVNLFAQLNAGRKARFAEELEVLRPLPKCRLNASVRIEARVGLGSTINVQKNIYSVNSRLIGAKVVVNIHADHIEVFYGQKLVASMPRLRGSGKHHIDYRHIIDWLVKKPGAFANYRFSRDLFPSLCFRLVYDLLGNDKEYLKILQLAAREGERKIETILKSLIDGSLEISAKLVKDMLALDIAPSPAQVNIAPVDLLGYDRLLVAKGGALAWTQ